MADDPLVPLKEARDKWEAEVAAINAIRSPYKSGAYDDAWRDYTNELANIVDRLLPEKE